MLSPTGLLALALKRAGLSIGVLLATTLLALPFVLKNAESMISSGSRVSVSGDLAEMPRTEIRPNGVVNGDRFVYAINGQAYILEENTYGPLISPIGTSAPVFRAFDISADGRQLLYSPLKKGRPSGVLIIEDLYTGITKQVTSQLTLSAAMSPVDPTRIAFTFAGQDGFGLGVSNLTDNTESVLVEKGVYAEAIRWNATGEGVHFLSTAQREQTVRLNSTSKPVDVFSRFGAWREKEEATSLVANEPEDVRLDLLSQFVTIDGRVSDPPPNGLVGFPIIEREDQLPLNLRLRPTSEEAKGLKARSFNIGSRDGIHSVAGEDFAGLTKLVVRNESSGLEASYDASYLDEVLSEGVVVKNFEPGRTVTKYIDWNGKVTELGVAVVDYRLPQANSRLIQGGDLYSSPGNCSLTAHYDSMGYAYDFENQTVGSHALATADGLVVYANNTMSCNFTQPGCVDYSPTGCPGFYLGNQVIILHSDGTYSAMSHLQTNSLRVAVGTSVCQGLFVAQQGHTGSTTGTFNGCGDHVHFQRQTSPDPSGQSIPATFSDVTSHPLTCGNTYNTSSTEIVHSISSSSQSFPIAGGNGSVGVTSTGCTWNVVSNASWITITSPGSGSGNSTVDFSVADNSTSGPRTGTMTIAGHTFTVTQAGGGVTNLAPVVNAGTDISANISVGAALSGSVSDDGLPAPPATITVTWSKVSGPGNVTFSNANGLSTTANFSLAGVYILRLTADDSALSSSDDIRVVVNVSGAGGILSGTQTTPSSPVDLTSEGTADWAHWGYIDSSSFDHKAGVTQQISNFTRIGTIGTLRSSDNWGPQVMYSWSDGTPDPGPISTATDVYTYGVGNGFEFTVPADTAIRTVKVYVGVWRVRGRFEAELSDGSASPYINNALSTVYPAGAINGVYTLTYKAASAGQTLRIRWFVETNSYPVGHVSFQSVSLAVGGSLPNQPPTVNAGLDSTITLPATASLSGSASDDGLPVPPGTITTTWSKVSGAGTVNFTNPNALSTAATFSLAGIYVLRLTANDGLVSASDDMVVTVNTTSGAGSLNGTQINPGPSNVDLTAEGIVDWTNWGLGGSASAFNRKNGVPPQISNFVPIGGAVQGFGNNPTTFDWTDGTPTTSASNNAGGLFNVGMGNGFEITVPADTSLRTIKLYVGVALATGRLEATLSDGSSSPYVDNSISDFPANRSGVYTLSYKAGSVGQTLTVRWTVSDALNQFGNVTLGAATLSGGGPANFAPVANAGQDQIIAFPSSAVLSGAASDDGQPIPPGALTTTWSKFSGPGTVTFGNVNSPATTASFSQAGTYVLRLTAFDGQLTSNDDISVMVTTGGGTLNGSQTNPGPANVDLTNDGTSDWIHWGQGNSSASVNRKNAVTPQISTFSSIGGSAQPFGNSPTGYTWTDGTPVTSTTTTEGVYVVGLNNGFLITAPADTSLRRLKVYVGVALAGGLLQATLSDGSANTYVDSSIEDLPANRSGVYTLDYSAATPGQTITVRWTVDDAPTPWSNVTLQAATLAILQINQPPTANAGSDQTVTYPAAANLSGSASDDGLPAPPALTTTWSQISGPGTVTFGDANQLNTTASFSAAGTHVLRLTASDGALSTTDDVTVTANLSPVVGAGVDQTITLPNTATLAGSASDDGLPAPPGTFTTAWSMFSGPGTVMFTNPNALNPIATFSVSGTYVLRLTADDSAATTTDDVTINVNASSGVGTLTGSTANAPIGNVNLTTDGPGDWVHWGLSSSSDFNDKQVSSIDISDYIEVGTGTVAQLTGSTTTYSWSDGTPPITSATPSGTGVTLSGVGNGFQFTVPADIVSRGLKVYLGLSQAGGTLEATLSDGSVAPIVDSSLANNAGTSNYVYSLNFRAGSNGQTLTVKWTANSMADVNGFVSLQAATLGDLYECDVAPRTLGSRTGTLTNADVIQMRRFLAGLDLPALPYQNNEFQRADCAGLATRGNNSITNADVIQARRFLAGLDVIPSAAGPSPSGLHDSLFDVGITKITKQADRVILSPAADDLTVAQASISGNQVIVGVYYQSPGDAVGAGFTLNWNPSHLTLTNPTSNVIVGNGAAGFWNLGLLNTTQIASGRLGVPMDAVSLTTPLPPGLRPILSVQFTINTPGNPTSTVIDFSDDLIQREITTVLNETRIPDTTAGTISLVAPTAAGVTLSGRVSDGAGRGLSRVMVSLTNAAGATRTAYTNNFGYYRIDDVRVGSTYTIAPVSKRYTFDPPSQVISVFDDVTDLDFGADER